MKVSESTSPSTDEVAPWPASVLRWIATFFDEESFLPIRTRLDDSCDPPPTIAGIGKVDGKHVTLIANAYPSMRGGGSGAAISAVRHATDIGCPVLLLTEHQGSDNSVDRRPVGGLARSLSRLSGVVPLINVEIGVPQSVRNYLADLCDFTVRVTPDSATKSADLMRDVDDASAWVQDLLSYIPPNNCEFASLDEIDDLSPTAELQNLVPALPSESYSLEPVLAALSDRAETLYVGHGHAEALVTLFTRIAGRAVGVLANNTVHGGGLFGPQEAKKAARFIRFCDAFNLPLLFLVDTADAAADEPSADVSYAQLVYATAMATVPAVTVILRKAHGTAADIFGAKDLGVDAVLAWPSASLSSAGYHCLVESEAHLELTDGARAEALQNRSAAAHDLIDAMDKGLIDHIIEPSESPQLIADWFATLDNKRRHNISKKHGNLPL